jgi:pimeloyl-ACP methyl ester carboxylesterase
MMAAALLSSGHISPAMATAPAVVPSADGVSALKWGVCASGELRNSGAECATLRVPLDHDDPRGSQASIALSRIRATAPASRYQGPMLVNPGGPGASGLTMPAYMVGALPESIASSYDWIGFDPRGVGRSRPAVRCDRRYFSLNRPDYFPKPAANRKQWQQRSRAYAAQCRANGKILRNIRTEDVARDVELMRIALGVERISYFGFSYGTYLGQVYATLHPQRLHRVVFDSNVNPRRVFYRANLDQDESFQKVFRRWFAWIADNAAVYSLGTSRRQVERRFTNTQAALAERPAGGKIGPAEWIDIFQTAAYSTYSWSDLAGLFSRFARTGTARPLVREFTSGIDYGDDNSFAVYNAVQCTDAPWPRTWRRWARDNWRTYRKAPLMTWPNAWFNAPCLYWPAPAGQRFPVDGSQAPPALLVSGTLDAATPYSGSEAVRWIFPQSRLVAIRAETGHATSLDGNPCVQSILHRYLATGALPARRAGTGADVTCNPLPPPRADRWFRSALPREQIVARP